MRRIMWYLIVLVMAADMTLAQQWMYLAVSSASITTQESCGDITEKMSYKQKLFCRNNYAIMRSLMDGAKTSLHECQQQFLWERWNCSVQKKDDDGNHTPFGDALLLGTREAAFLSSIFAAGLTYSIISDCSGGRLPDCRCVVQPQGELDRVGTTHRGCDINLGYGLTFAKSFLDQQKPLSKTTTMSTKRKMMYEHNYETGRQVLRENIARSCRCHGVSGACSLQVCSKDLPDFRQVGNVLKQAYEAAVQVTLGNIGSRRALIKKLQETTEVWQTDLVYYEPSPDYCNADLKSGIPGTVGRRCNKLDLENPGSSLKHGYEGTCESLCCGRKFKRDVITIKKTCNCKFHWCCRVTCDTCIYKKIVYVCQ